MYGPYSRFGPKTFETNQMQKFHAFDLESKAKVRHKIVNVYISKAFTVENGSIIFNNNQLRIIVMLEYGDTQLKYVKNFNLDWFNNPDWEQMLIDASNWRQTWQNNY